MGSAPATTENEFGYESETPSYDLFKKLAAQVRRHVHPVGLWHAPSFEKFPVPRVSPGNLFSGSWIDQAGFVDTLTLVCVFLVLEWS